MVLGKLPVPGRPTYVDYSRARAYCACSRCGWGLFGHFFSLYPFSPFSPFLWETSRYRLKYCLKGPLNPKQPTKKIFQNSPRSVAQSGPSCSELTIKVPLKFQTLISEICQYFLLKKKCKSFSYFFNKKYQYILK